MKNATEPLTTPHTQASPRWALFAAVTLAVVVADQLTKWWALTHLAPGEEVRVLGDLFTLTLVFNPGAAFGTGAGYTIALSVVAIGVSAALVVVARRLIDPVWTVALAMFLGGALGNLIDRIAREPGFLQGHVVDFLNYGGWFVGNVADIALTVAAIMVVFRSWTGVRLDGSTERD